MLQHHKDKLVIPSILDPTGKPTQDPHDINNSFRHFYSDLYSVLNSVRLPTLSKDQSLLLDQPITVEELFKALYKACQ